MRLKKVPCQLYMINYWTTAIYSSQDYVASQSQNSKSQSPSVPGPSEHWGVGEAIVPPDFGIGAKPCPSKGLELELYSPLDFQTFLRPCIN